MSQNECDIVVTGLTSISAAGVGIEHLRDAVSRRNSFLKPVPAELAELAGYQWGKADGFRVGDFMTPLKARKFDRCSLFAVAATGQALTSAGINRSGIDPERIGIVLGSGFGGIANSEEFLRGYFTGGTDGLIPMLFPNTVPNAPASNASIEHKIKGPNITLVQRFCSAEAALQLGVRFLEEGRADVIVTGGVDELTPMMMKGYLALGQLRRFLPGFGEGAGMLVLERRSHARQRGAKVLATVNTLKTIGRLLPGAEAEGAARLLPASGSSSLVSLSGSAARETILIERLPAVSRLEIGPLLGYSLAMGGNALAATVMALGPGQTGIHLAASPEGPYFAIELTGGDPV